MITISWITTNLKLGNSVTKYLIFQQVCCQPYSQALRSRSMFKGVIGYDVMCQFRPRARSFSVSGGRTSHALEDASDKIQNRNQKILVPV